MEVQRAKRIKQDFLYRLKLKALKRKKYGERYDLVKARTDQQLKQQVFVLWYREHYKK